MYARVALATGWTWEYIGQCLTLPRLLAMAQYWKRYPPLHEIVALFAGYKPEAEKAQPMKVDNVWAILKEGGECNDMRLMSTGARIEPPRMPSRG